MWHALPVGATPVFLSQFNCQPSRQAGRQPGSPAAAWKMAKRLVEMLTNVRIFLSHSILHRKMPKWQAKSMPSLAIGFWPMHYYLWLQHSTLAIAAANQPKENFKLSTCRATWFEISINHLKTSMYEYNHDLHAVCNKHFHKILWKFCKTFQDAWTHNSTTLKCILCMLRRLWTGKQSTELLKKEKLAQQS